MILRGLIVNPKDLIIKMKKILANDKYPSIKDSITKNYFTLRFLTAAY